MDDREDITVDPYIDDDVLDFAQSDLGLSCEGPESEEMDQMDTRLVRKLGCTATSDSFYCHITHSIGAATALSYITDILRIPLCQHPSLSLEEPLPKKPRVKNPFKRLTPRSRKGAIIAVLLCIGMVLLLALVSATAYHLDQEQYEEEGKHSCKRSKERQYERWEADRPRKHEQEVPPKHHLLLMLSSPVAYYFCYDVLSCR